MGVSRSLRGWEPRCQHPDRAGRADLPPAKARDYGDDPGACFERLADNPRLGRPARDLGLELRRYEHRSHVILYRQLGTSILAVRVLHYRLEVTRQTWQAKE